MKKILLSFAVLLTLIATTVTSYSESSASHLKLLKDEQNNIWRVDTRTGRLLTEAIDSSVFTFPSQINGYKIMEIDDYFTEDMYLSLTEITIPDGYTYIGDYAFADCKYLKKVTLPDSVKYIGKGAFQNCVALEEIKLPKKLETLGSGAFSGCKLIKSITIPEKVTTIGANTFASCTSLESIELHDNITSIEAGAFYYSGIKDIVIPDTATHIGNQILEGTPWINDFDSDFVVINNILIQYKGSKSIINIPDNVHYIASGVFYNNEATHINIPNSVKKIGNYVFEEMPNIKTLRIPESVKEIGDGLFYRSSIEEVYFPSSITKIPDYTFARSKVKRLCLTDNITEIGKYAYHFTYLTDLHYMPVTIPDSVKVIGESAFENAFQLGAVKKLSMADDVVIGNNAFFGCPIADVEIGDKVVYDFANPFVGSTWWVNIQKNNTDKWIIIGDGNLVEATVDEDETDILVPEGVKRICRNAISGGEGKRLVLPSTMVEITDSNFLGSTFSEVVINDEIKSIGGSAFRYCDNLHKINWPDHISTVPYRCFEGCSLLGDFDFTGVTEIGEEAFKNTGVLFDGTLPKSIRKIGKNAFYNGPFSNFYLEHFPEEADDYCFGDFDPTLVYLHIPEGLTDHNPYWNMHTLVMHTNVEVVDTGSNSMILYFKYGIDEDSFLYKIKVGNSYSDDFGGANYKILDDNHIEITNIYDWHMGDAIQFEEKTSLGWCLVQYDPIIIEKNTEGKIHAFTYDRENKITGYLGNETYIEIPETINDDIVTGIAENAFPQGNITLKLSKNISSVDVKSIGNGTRFEVDSENPYFAANNGCLYSADFKKLVCCATDGTWWNGNANEIGDYAFYNSDILYAEISENITKVGKQFTRNGDMALYFTGKIPELAENAFSEHTRAYAESETNINGVVIRKRLGDYGIYTFFEHRIDNDNRIVTIPVYIYREIIPTLQIVTEITYCDGTIEIFTNDTEKQEYFEYSYNTIKDVEKVSSYLWYKSSMHPVAYKETTSK